MTVMYYHQVHHHKGAAMATTKPRITLTLSDRTYKLLKSISDCSNQPMSTFVNEMLESASPTLERMAVTFQKIKQAQETQRKQYLADLDEAQAAIEPVVQNTLGQFDLFLERIEDAVGIATATDARGARAGAGGIPAAGPLTNRGTHPRGKGSKAMPVKALKPVTKKQPSIKKQG